MVEAIKLIGYCHLRLECRLQNVRVSNRARSKIARKSWRRASRAYSRRAGVRDLLSAERKLLFLIHVDNTSIESDIGLAFRCMLLQTYAQRCSVSIFKDNIDSCLMYDRKEMGK